MMSLKRCFYVVLLFVSAVNGCKEGNKAVGVCLHVYLERDFLSLEKIVYPSSKYDRYRRSYVLNNQRINALSSNFTNYGTEIKDNYTEMVADSYKASSYSNTEWIEGPELEDHCKRLKGVVKCFETVLFTCDTAKDFFSYRHLLYALNEAHKFLCYSAHTRKEKFLRFLKTIQCSEKARKEESSCHRHNVSSIVWNQILRVEVGEEICHSLSTQRACLLEHNYIKDYCRDPDRVQIYADLSGYFLSIWCKLAMHPKLVMERNMMSNKAIILNLYPHWIIFYVLLLKYLQIHFVQNLFIPLNLGM